MKSQSASSPGHKIIPNSNRCERVIYFFNRHRNGLTQVQRTPRVHVCSSLALFLQHLDVGLPLSVTWKFECLCSDGLHLFLWAVLLLWWWWWRRRLIFFAAVWILQFNQSHVLQCKNIRLLWKKWKIFIIRHVRMSDSWWWDQTHHLNDFLCILHTLNVKESSRSLVHLLS